MITAPLTCMLALAQPWPIALSIYAHSNHLHPVPGEVQAMRWSVHNDGVQRLDHVRLDVRPPADWTVDSAPGCTSADDGVLHCVLGPLDAGHWLSQDIRMAVPDKPQLGTFRITGRSAVTAGNSYFSGPTATLTVTVVRHR